MVEVEPLRWPDHYPPTSRWRRFFLGFPLLGPDLSFLKRFRAIQASRADEVMKLWPTPVSRHVAEIIGESVVNSGLWWVKPFFAPADHFAVVMHGPRFRTIDDLAADSAACEIERRLGRKFSDEFWVATQQLSVGKVVQQMLERGAAA